MKKISGKRMVAWKLTLAMLIGICPMTVFVSESNAAIQVNSKMGCGYYNVISQNEYALADGATEKEIVINDDTGNNKNIVHVMEVDTKNPNITVMPTYKGISDNIDYSNSSNWGTQTMPKQVEHVEKNLGLNVVGAMNMCLSWDFTHPYGLLLYKGKVLYDGRADLPAGENFGYLAIMKDGTAELRGPFDALTGEEWMAQTIEFGIMLKDGKIYGDLANEDHSGDRRPRSVIGIKEDGTLVLMVVEGDSYSSSKSRGFTAHEIAYMMLELGCVDAINCDGGGSSAFLTERADGSQKLRNNQDNSSQGTRAVANGIAIISNGIPTPVFTSATLTASSDSVKTNHSVTIDVAGVDATGAPIDLPDDLTLELADNSYGTLSNGVFTAGNKLGNAVINAVSNGKVVGSITILVKANAGLQVIDNYYYFVYLDGTIAKGERYIWGNGIFPDGMYTFAEDGRMLGVKVVDGIHYTGEIVDVDGELYYYKNGKKEPAGLLLIDGNYYFVGVGGKLATGKSYVWKGNGIMSEDVYTFGEDGKMLGIKLENGKRVTGEIVKTGDKLYYYDTGKAEQKGIIEIDGYYYFVGLYGEIATGRTYVWRGNGILPDDVYTFDKDGKMLGIKIANGKLVIGEIVEDGGKLYYYDTGKAEQKGIFKIDGYYYFVGLYGEIATGRTYVWRGNGILEDGHYTFAADGKYIAN